MYGLTSARGPDTGHKTARCIHSEAVAEPESTGRTHQP